MGCHHFHCFLLVIATVWDDVCQSVLESIDFSGNCSSYEAVLLHFIVILQSKNRCVKGVLHMIKSIYGKAQKPKFTSVA